MGKLFTIITIIFTIAIQSEYVIADGRLEFEGKAKYNEQPVSGATVTLYALGSTKKRVSTVQTKYDGKFAFSMDFDKMYRIEWNKTGYTEMVILINGFVPAAEKGWNPQAPSAGKRAPRSIQESAPPMAGPTMKPSPNAAPMIPIP